MNDTFNDLNAIDRVLIPSTAFETARRRLQQHFEASKTCQEPVCLGIIGKSRSGKSRVLDDLMRQHPRERGPGGMHVPILRISTPSKPTVKGLSGIMLDALGDPLWNKRATEIEKTRRLGVLLEKAGTSMIVIDEFQHFHDPVTGKVNHEVSDWLKNLIEASKTFLVVAGLPSCRAVIDQNSQLSGRFASAVHIPQYDWKNVQSRREFIGILHGLQQAFPHYEMPALKSESMAFRFYCASGGLIGYVIKILRQAVWNAIAEGRTHMRLEHLEQAFEEAVWQTSSQTRLNPFELDFDPSPNLAMLGEATRVGDPAEAATYSRPVRREKTDGGRRDVTRGDADAV